MPGTTPIYGFPYPEPTDLVADYPALGQQLAEDIEAVLPDLGGLIASPPTTIANSGGTATLSGNTVTFSGVSSVSLNGCFTGDYANYRVLVDLGSNANANVLQMRLRAAGSDNTSSAYETQQNRGADTSLSGTRIANTFWSVGYANYSITVFDIVGPHATNKTFTNGSCSLNGGASIQLWAIGQHHNVAASYDGFTLYPASGTITGTAAVYGYRK